MSRIMRKPAFCICENKGSAKTKVQISFEVTAQLISVFVFATLIVQSLYFLNLKFQVSNHLLWLYSPVCVGPGRIPQRQVYSRIGSYRMCWEFPRDTFTHDKAYNTLNVLTHFES